MSATAAEITFGKYKGKPLAEVPTDYLEWLQGQGIKSPRLAEAIDADLRRRGGAAAKPPAAAQQSGDALEAALRQLEAAAAAVRAAVAKR